MLDKYLDLLKKQLGEDVKVLSSLHGGMMNEAYIVLSKKGKFVFYIPTSQANEMVDRKLEKETQDIAEDLNITRKTFYFDEKTGIKILKFIDGDSLNHIEEFNPKKVAELFNKLHSSNKLASMNYCPFNKLVSYKKEASSFVKKFDESFYEIFDLLMNKKVFLESQELKLCHNDAQRSNIVFDGKDYYLIDYEFSMNNDPIYDVATFGNDDVNDGIEVLKEYIKIKKVDNAFERYYLWRMDISLQWYLVALIKHYRGEGKIHNIDFMMVANHFLENAKDAYKKYLNYVSI